MEYKLEFRNPVYHDGVNVTIRRGDKWAKLLKEYDTVTICGLDGLPLIEGIVVSVHYKSFYEVNILDLFEEHDPECRNPDGLVRAMLQAYPEFTLEDYVTVIRFNTG